MFNPSLVFGQLININCSLPGVTFVSRSRIAGTSSTVLLSDLCQRGHEKVSWPILVTMLPEEVVLRGPNAKDLTFTILCWWLSMLRSIDPLLVREFDPTCERVCWMSLLGFPWQNYQGEIPFSSDRKRMSVIVKHEGPQLSKEIRPKVESIVWLSVCGWERIWVPFHGNESWGEYWCLCKGADNIMGSCPQIAGNLDFLHCSTVCLTCLTLLFDMILHSIKA